MRSVTAATKPGLHPDGDGLYLHVTPNGARSWILRFKRAGRSRDMGLGSLDDVSLAEARDLAIDNRRLLRQGVDPIEVRREARAKAQFEAASAITFKACAEQYVASHEAGWRNAKHAAQWPSTLKTYVYPVFGDIAVQAIDVGLVMKAIDPIWAEKPETASRVRGRIESVLDWARARGYRKGENPARWRGHLENLLPKKTKVRTIEHYAALPYAEVGSFMMELRTQDGTAARALEFAILTAARTGEAIGARWEEFDLIKGIWTIPAERMKAGREHRVALSTAAIAIVRKMAEAKQGEFVFAGAKVGRPLSNMAMLMALRRMKRDDLTAHGFRSTFRDWAAERSSFPAEVAEMALAHVVGDKVEAAYRRGDLFQKRRQLAEAWAKFCTSAPAEGRVVPIRTAAAR